MTSGTTTADERIDVHTNPDKFQNYLHWQRYNRVLMSIAPASSILEIGTGLGVFSEMIRPRVAVYRGIEYDLAACKTAQDRIGSETLITQGDAHSLTFSDDSFDEVVCLEVLEHLTNYRLALDEIVRVLRPQSRLHVSIPYRRIGAASNTNPHHLYEPGEREFLAELGRRFGKVAVMYQRYEETPMMGVARKLHLRRVLGLVAPYKRLTEGDEQKLQKVYLDSSRQGMLLGIFCDCFL